MRPTGLTFLALTALVTACGRTGLDAFPADLPGPGDMDASAGPDVATGPDAAASLDAGAGPDVTEGRDAAAQPDPKPDATDPCASGCSLSFTSSPDWESFAAGAGPDAGDSHGASLGPARDVCTSFQVPANCPTAASGVVVYGFGQSGWTAGSSSPQALWIWRGDVAPNAAADLQVAVFERSFDVGAEPTGSIQIGADDFAAVFVNDVTIGSVGSVDDVTVASESQNVGATLDLTFALRPGTNKITVVGRNGPASFAGGCGGVGCTYAQNPAGVVFAGALTWR